MTNMVQNNEAIKNANSLSLLTNNLIYKGYYVMANQLIPRKERICQIEGCENFEHARGFCSKHYMQWWEHDGKIPDRTIRTPNEFIIKNDICLISLHDRYGNSCGNAIIDAEDYEKVKDYKWSLYNDGVSCGELGKKLHHIILGFEYESHDKIVDHKNRNTKDNRKCNLRKCNNAENTWNRGLSKNNKSGYKGVCWHKTNKKWAANINVNKKRMFLGYFKTKEAAAYSFNEAALEHHGEFAYQNNIQGNQL